MATRSGEKQEFGKVVVLIPVFNDWGPASRVVEKLDGVLAGRGMGADVVLVDDASTVRVAGEFRALRLKAIEKVEVLSLRRNLGHQRAIAIGLAHIEQNVECDALA